MDPVTGNDTELNERPGLDAGSRQLDRAYEALQREVPDRVSRAISWLRDPKRRLARIPIGAILILSSFLWFLPTFGIEFLSLGLLLIAEDVPFLRNPVGRIILWLVGRWVALRKLVVRQPSLTRQGHLVR